MATACFWFCNLSVCLLALVVCARLLPVGTGSGWGSSAQGAGYKCMYNKLCFRRSCAGRLFAATPQRRIADEPGAVPAPSPFQPTHGSAMVCKTGSFCRRYFVSFIISMLAVCLLASVGSAQQGLPSTVGTASVTVSSPLQTLNPSDPLLGSVPEGQLDPNPIQLTLLGAIDRGLKRNLGLLLADQNTRLAEGAQVDFA